MIWLSWRQMRASVAVAIALLAAVLAMLIVTGIHLNHMYSTYRGCTALTCSSLLQRLETSYRHVKLTAAALVAVPAVLGIFWGAPLISRELESGTFRVAWTQGVSRTRWLAAKMGIAGLATAVAAGVLTFAISWWSIPFDRIDDNRLDPSIFTERGVVPIAYALFAFALGVAAGALFRRTLPAIATTLFGFIGVRMVVQFLVRPHLLTPLVKSAALSPHLGVGIDIRGGHAHLDVSLPQLRGAWVTGSKLVDASGHMPSSSFIRSACQAVFSQAPPSAVPGGPTKQAAPPAAVRAFQSCIENVGTRYHEVVSYQPESRFWELQWIESAIFLGLTALLVGLTVYWVRRRLS